MSKIALRLSWILAKEHSIFTVNYYNKTPYDIPSISLCITVCSTLCGKIRPSFRRSAGIAGAGPEVDPCAASDYPTATVLKAN
jgi:hypothetical protein